MIIAIFATIMAFFQFNTQSKTMYISFSYFFWLQDLPLFFVTKSSIFETHA